MLFIGLIAVGAVIGFVAAASRTHSDGYYRNRLSAGQRFWNGVGVGICTAFVCGLVGLFVGALVKGDVEFRAPDAPARILSFQDSLREQTDANGGLVLATGWYKSHENVKTTYQFYQEAPDGTFFLHSVEADADTRVRLDLTAPGVVPTATRKYPEERCTTPEWVAPFDLCVDGKEGTMETWVIKVPRGTIVRQFRADGE